MFTWPSTITRLTRFSLISLALTCSSVALAQTSTPPQSHYTVTDLGLPSGYAEAYAADINDKGQVFGSVYPTRNSKGLQHLVVWQNGKIIDLGNGTDTYYPARQLNNSGQVIGELFSSQDAFVWQINADGTAKRTTLPLLPNSTGAAPNSINDQGDIVGLGYSGGQPDGFLWHDPGTGYQIESIGRFTPLGISNDGQIVGYTVNVSGQTTAVLARPNYIYIGQNWFDSGATRINVAGQIIGYYQDNHRSDIHSRGVLWQKDVTNTYQGTDIGLPGYSGSVASGINDSGQVVGSAFPDTGDDRPFLYQVDAQKKASVIDLNTLLPADSGWVLTDAEAINNKGQIVGFGLHNGLERAFLLSPPLLGVDVSQGSQYAYDSAAYQQLKDKDGKQFVIANAWTGFSQYYDTLDNLNAAQGGGITNLAAYMELNYFSGSDFSGSDNSGRQQVQNAFASVSGFPIAFMAVGVEPLYHNSIEILVPANVDFVQRIADAVQAVRSQGIPAIIYTRNGASQHWKYLTGNSKEIQGVPLWDVDPINPGAPYKIITSDDPVQPTLDGFSGYGGFTTRIGRQYVLSIPKHPAPNLEGIGVDEDIFDPSAFSLPKPPIGCMPALSITELLSRSGSNLVVTGTLNDNAPSSAPLSDALATRITAATLTTATGRTLPVSTTTALPIRLNTIPVGGGALFQLTFPAPVGATGTRVVLRIQGTYGGGSFAFSLRGALP